MKKFSVIIAIVGLVSFKGFAQNMGISSTGATPDPSAMLDIVSNNKGLLIPRVSLTALNVAAPVTAPFNSLLVYNTATSGVIPFNVVPGYYYWQSSTNRWVSLSGSISGSNNWNVLGNAGTTPTINFIGTVDNADLVFKTNNVEQMRLYSSGIFGNLQGNTVGSDGQGINAKTFSWESPNNGYAATIFNSGIAATQNGLAVKVAGTNSAQIILNLSTGTQSIPGINIMSARADGNIGIGTNAPVSNLSVNGTADKIGGGAWAVFSDARVKQNINKYNKGLEYIIKIEPVTFEYNGKGGNKVDGKTYVGIIAQEIEKVLPSTVSKVATKDFEDQRIFDSSELTFTLINAVKELNKKTEELNNTIQQLEKKIKLLEDKK